MKKLQCAFLFALVLSLGAFAADSAQPAEQPQAQPDAGLPAAAEPEEAKPAADADKSAAEAAAKPAAEPAAKPAAKPAAAVPAAAQDTAANQGAALPDREDDIDLEEVDDSADAAKRPTVKFIAQPEQVQAEQTSPEPAAQAAEAPAADAPSVPAEPAAAQAQQSAAAAAPAVPARTAPAVSDSSESALVDISCDDATLADILRQFRKTTGANIISGDSTNLLRRVSVNLNHVPWLQALQSILNSRGFRLEPREGIYFVSEDKQLDPLFTRAYTLNHASSEELARLFNATYSAKNAQGVPIQPVATAFPGANVVVVTTTEKVLRDCELIIKAVDRPVSQVYIEARFIEISNEALRKLGMQWDSLSSWGATVKGLSGGWEYNSGRAANYGSKLSQVTSTTSPSSSTSLDAEGKGTTSTSTSLSDAKTYTGLVPNAITAADGANRTANSMSWRNARGFSGQLSVDDFRLAMSAFEQLGEGRVFSNPKIIVSNGKEAKVDMTKKYPNVTIDSNFTGQNQNSLSVSTKLDTIPGEDKQMFAKEAFFSWGIMLTVKPRISPDGLINVEIVPTISDCTDYATVQSSQESDTPYTKYPVIEVKRLTTDFTMMDGATAVIGGLSRTIEEDIDSGIPFLRKIPWIGRRLFGWTSRQKVQKEIIVFVTVGIADPRALPSDIGLPKNAVMGREYVVGTRLEPGDRQNVLQDFNRLDDRPLDERAAHPAKAEPESSGGKKGESSGAVVIKLSGDDPEPRPDMSTSVDGSVSVRRVSQENPSAAAPAPAPVQQDESKPEPAPLVNPDTATSVEDLLSDK